VQSFVRLALLIVLLSATALPNERRFESGRSNLHRLQGVQWLPHADLHPAQSARHSQDSIEVQLKFLALDQVRKRTGRDYSLSHPLEIWR